MDKLFEIIHEDNGLLVINKPAGLVCHPTKGDVYSSLISRVRLHLGAGGEPQLINRLDRETSGVVLAAKDPTTARYWRRRWESRDVEKVYLAIVRGHVERESGCIDAPLGKDERSAVAIKDTVRPDGAAAETEFRVLRRFVRAEGDFTLLEARPLSGRKHQIRIHLAHLGHAIVGDKLYGGDERLYLDLVSGKLTDEQRRALLTPHHALHARLVRCGEQGRETCFEAEPEEWFRRFAGVQT
jgi:23S rRNA pseudouridine1911/1915/1917 synthase